MTDAMKVVFFF